jgi:hypothetical protein
VICAFPVSEWWRDEDKPKPEHIYLHRPYERHYGTAGETERTDDPIEVVARRAGYDAAVTMRAQFASRLHTSPRGYRQTFREPVTT